MLLCGLASAQFYLIVYRLPCETFYSGDCGIKLLQVQSLVARQWRSLALIYPGEVVDPDHRFVETGGLVVRKGRVFGSHSAAFALVSSFPYARLGYGGLYVVPAVSLLAAGLLLWLAARPWYGPWRALLAFALLSSATPLLFYGLEFWEHTLAVLVVTGALALLLAPPERASPWRLGAAGAVLALAFSVRPESAVFFAAVVLGLTATLRPWSALARSLVWFVLGYALVLAPITALNEWVFGDPWGTLLGLHLRGGHPDARGLVATKLLCPLEHACLTKLALAAGAAVALWRLRRRELRGARGWQSAVLALLAGGGILTIAALDAGRVLSLWRQPRQLTSLVETFPLIWALPLVVATWRGEAGGPTRARERFLIVTALAFLAGVLAVSPTWGGAQWGPRQLLLVMPLLALLAVSFGPVSRPSGRIALLAVLLLATLSLGIQIGGVRLLADMKGKYVNFVRNFAGLTEPGAVIASDQFFFQELLAPIYYQRHFFYLASPQLSGDFMAALRRAKVRQFYFFCRRGPRPGDADLLRQLRAHHLSAPGLTPLRGYSLDVLPYYLVRLRLDEAVPPGPPKAANPVR